MPDEHEPPKPPTFNPITVDGSAWNPANWAPFVSAIGVDRFSIFLLLGLVVWMALRPQPQNLASQHEFAGIRRVIHAQAEANQAFSEALAAAMVPDADPAKRQRAADKLTAEIARQTDYIHQAFREEE
jgi:hypothetical protein